MEAYISIDYTNDFIHDNGALTLKERGQAIEKAMVTFVKEGLEQKHLVVLAMDCHRLDEHNHPENKLFPPHNLEGSFGQQCFGQLNDIYQAHQNEMIWLNKRRYSAFYHTPLVDYLRENHIETIHLSGVCTHICVLQTAIDAYYRGFNIVVHSHACASFSDEEHEFALRYMQEVLGAEVI